MDDGSPVIEHPSCHEAFQAVATIQKFITEINVSFARKLGNLFTTFGHVTQLKVTFSIRKKYLDY